MHFFSRATQTMQSLCSSRGAACATTTSERQTTTGKRREWAGQAARHHVSKRRSTALTSAAHTERHTLCFPLPRATSDQRSVFSICVFLLLLLRQSPRSRPQHLSHYSFSILAHRLTTNTISLSPFRYHILIFNCWRKSRVSKDQQTHTTSSSFLWSANLAKFFTNASLAVINS